MTDTQGSTAMLADSSGNPQQLDRYDEAGIPGPVNIGRFQYMGQPYIPEIGLYDNRARIYSPNLGRFLQTDPIGYGDGMNWYNYAHGDPVNGSDPSGTEFAFEDDGGDGGGGGGDGGGGGGGGGGGLYDPPSCQDDSSCVPGPNVNTSPFCASCFNPDGGSSASTSITSIGTSPPNSPAPKPSATVKGVTVTLNKRTCIPVGNMGARIQLYGQLTFSVGGRGNAEPGTSAERLEGPKLGPFQEPEEAGAASLMLSWGQWVVAGYNPVPHSLFQWIFGTPHGSVSLTSTIFGGSSRSISVSPGLYNVYTVDGGADPTIADNATITVCN